MEEIEKRLSEATAACLATHAEWAKDKKNGATRESLMEAVHELRKVAARLEIEMAVSERDEMAAKPIPIPPHRASKRRPGEMNDFPGDDDSQGNMDSQQGGGGDSGIARTMRRRRPHGGPGGHGGGGFNNNNNGNNGNNGNNNGNAGNRAE